MRIISGKYGHRRFDIPKGFKLRPTTDLAKEALFSTITSMFSYEGARILDLFAGTGSIGLEFASRGAKWVDMVEKQPKQVAFIQTVIKALHAEDEAAVHVGSVFKWLSLYALRSHLCGSSLCPRSPRKAAPTRLLFGAFDSRGTLYS